MLANAYFLSKFRFDTAENDPAKNLQTFANSRRQPGDLRRGDHREGRAGRGGPPGVGRVRRRRLRGLPRRYRPEQIRKKQMVPLFGRFFFAIFFSMEKTSKITAKFCEISTYYLSLRSLALFPKRMLVSNLVWFQKWRNRRRN